MPSFAPMKLFPIHLGVLLLLSLLISGRAAFGQSDTSSTHAVVISPGNTNFLNPDHIRPVTPYVPPAVSPGQTAPTTSTSVFVPPNPLPAHPHWTWDIQNREFVNVVVTKVEADLVTINCDSGPTKIDISLLPPEIQKELNYDPEMAAKASAARDAEAAKSTPPPAGN